MPSDQKRRPISLAYAREKLERLANNLETFNSGELWCELSRIAEGATGIPHAESLRIDLERAERKLEAAVSSVSA